MTRTAPQGCGEARHPDGYLSHAKLVPEHKVFFRRLRLAAQRLDLKLQLAYLVVYAQEIFLGFGKLALGILLAAAVARYARGLLEYFPAVGAFRRDYLSYPALTYYRIAVAAETRVHQEAVYVLEPYGLAVYIILAVPAAVIPAGEHKLCAVAVKGVLGIVDD